MHIHVLACILILKRQCNELKSPPVSTQLQTLTLSQVALYRVWLPDQYIATLCSHRYIPLLTIGNPLQEKEVPCADGFWSAPEKSTMWIGKLTYNENTVWPENLAGNLIWRFGGL